MKRMSPESWQALSGLWDEAMALRPAERAAWLERLRREAHPLRAPLEEMLGALGSVETGDFLATMPRAPRRAEPGALRAGECVGAYRLERPLGRGGMAEVWLARRADGELKRPVALKLLHRWHGGAAFAPRFERERDILAALHHPHIASLFDAGVSERGESFLALEYVDGEPLTAHAERRRLAPRERIALFRQVLLAVQHAHASLVLHRDLKPANILVHRDGSVKLLDFGIAKLLAEPDQATPETELTRAAGRPLTPLYASPEQLRGEPLSTASDVYSLGVVLYELLCGQRPHDAVAGQPGALEQAILAVDPRPPSQRVTAEAAAGFGRDARALRRILAGELDALVQKALAKSPAQRYSSVDALLADVDRWLAGEPVLARPPGGWLRLRKFAARHRLGVSLGGAALAGLLGLTAVALVQQQRARDESARAVAARDFLLDLFRGADPQFNHGATPSARELLAAAPAEAARLADQPQLQRELLDGLWRVQRDTDDHAAADATLGRLVALQRQLGDAHGVAMAQAHQAELALRLGDEARSAALLAAVRASGWIARDPALAFVAAEQQGWLDREQGRPEAAQRAFEEARVQAGRAHGEASLQTVEALRGLMTVAGDRADFPSALAYADRALAIAARAPAAGTPERGGLQARERIGLQFERADLAYRSGQIARSAREAAAAGAQCDAVVGRHSETCLRLAQTEALSLMRLGEARRAAERLEPLARSLDAIGSPVRRAELVLIAARVAMRDGRLDPASGWTERLRELAADRAAPPLPGRLAQDARLALAEAALRDGEPQRAADWLAAYRARAGRAESPSRADALADLVEGGVARARGQAEAARRAFASAHAQHVALLGARHPVTLAVSLNLALHAHEQGRDAEARTLLQAAAPDLRQAFGTTAPFALRLQRLEQAVAGGSEAGPARAAGDLFF